MMSQEGYKAGKCGKILPQNSLPASAKVCTHARIYLRTYILTQSDFSFEKHHYSQFTTP